MIAADFLSAVTPRPAPGTMSDTASKPIAIPRSMESRAWRTSSAEVLDLHALTRWDFSSVYLSDYLFSAGRGGSRQA